MSDYFIKTLTKAVTDSLDAELPQNVNIMNCNVLNSLNSQHAKIMVNASPLADKRQFTEYWLKLPLTQHRTTDFDYHEIPGLNLANVLVSGKVRFDESGKNKLNESADIVNIGTGAYKSRPLWGPWFGFTLVLVVDTSKKDPQQECIASFDYKINYANPESVIQV